MPTTQQGRRPEGNGRTARAHTDLPPEALSEHPTDRAALAEAVRLRLHKIAGAGGSQDHVQRLMLALGYAVALTPTGNPGFTRGVLYRGRPVNVWVAEITHSAWPSTLLEPVWVGYYTPEEPVEMIQCEEYDRLMDYLHTAHPEAFGLPQGRTLP